MHKILTTIIIAALPAFSLADDYSKICNNIKDSTTAVVCNISKRINVSPIKVGLASFMVSTEDLASQCGFKFSNDFILIYEKTRNDSEILVAKKYISKEYGGKKRYAEKDKLEYCRREYQIMMSGGGAKMFK